MSDTADYSAEDWTIAAAEADYKSKPIVVIKVDDRAATRKAIIRRARLDRHGFIERSQWGAKKVKPGEFVNDWDYTMIAIHRAGRSFACGSPVHQLKYIQETHQEADWLDIGYHYAVACTGEIYECRDIRFKEALINSGEPARGRFGMSC